MPDQGPPRVLLSFDAEEFDLPAERGLRISQSEQFDVGARGLEVVHRLLADSGATATFFTTVSLASNAPDLVRKVATAHEIASHGLVHKAVPPTDYLRSREALEAIVHKPVVGFRMPRMAAVDEPALAAAGFRYHSSTHPTWLPGRYNNLRMPRGYSTSGPLVSIPASVTPLIRFPLFWLSFKNFPQPIYRHAVGRVLRTDRYAVFYFHPWEFVDLSKYKLPAHVTRHSGQPLVDRLHRFIDWLKPQASLSTFEQFVGTLPTS
ncbi:MAG: polysaccharide deacetylase family protein [Planctomycetota bacterium]